MVYSSEWVPSGSDSRNKFQILRRDYKNATREIKALPSRKVEIDHNIRDSIILNYSVSSCSFIYETNRKI